MQHAFAEEGEGMKKNRLVKTNILIGLVLLTGFALTACLAYQANYQTSLNNIEQVSSLSSEGIQYQLTSMLTRPVNTSLAMAHDSFLKEHLAKENEQITDQSYIDALRTYLYAYKEKYKFDSVFLVSCKSRRYYSYNGLDRILDKKNRENAWYYDLLYSKDEYSLHVDNDEVDGAGNEITVFVNCRITDEAHNTIGVVGVGIRLKNLRELLAAYEKKYNIKAYLVDDTGNIQVSTANSAQEQVNWFAKYKQQENQEEILQWKQDQKNLELWTKQDGEKSYLVTRYVPELSWHLIVQQNTETVLQQMYAQLLHIALMMLAVILIVLAIITFVIRSFNRQITSLIEEKQAIFRKATEELYDNIYELNITKNSYVGERTANYFESLGAKGLPYDEVLTVIAQKQIKEEFRDGYVSLFTPEHVIQEYEAGNNHLQYDFMISEEGSDYFWMRIDAYVFLSTEDNCIHMFTYRKNINAEKNRERLAAIDDMTGFYTRKACVEAISIRLERRTEEAYAFLLFDIDNFKQANDQFGHAFGDYCITEFTKAIRTHFRKGDILGRVGGDEFVVLCKYKTYEQLMNRVHVLSQDLVMQCERKQASWHMSASIGIALSPKHGSDFETLYECADKALYETKVKGKNGFCVYHSGHFGEK